MTILQFIGCLIFNTRHCNIILKNKKDKILVTRRIIFALFMTYLLINKAQFFIVFTIIKTIYDMISLLIKVEASGVVSSSHKEAFIDDIFGLVSFIIYVGG